MTDKRIVSYCNMIGLSQIGADVGNLQRMIDIFCKNDLEAGLVMPSWWATYHESVDAKCNLWFFDTSIKLRENLFCERINLVIFFVNLSDVQAVKQLEAYKKSIEYLGEISVVVLGIYVHDSALVEAQRVKVLEWLADDDRLGEAPFLPVDLQMPESDLMRIWEEIFSFGLL